MIRYVNNTQYLVMILNVKVLWEKERENDIELGNYIGFWRSSCSYIIKC